jgi:hypothetical protein
MLFYELFFLQTYEVLAGGRYDHTCHLRPNAMALERVSCLWLPKTPNAGKSLEF